VAEDVSRDIAVPAPPAETPVVTPTPPRDEPRRMPGVYLGRFRLVYALLAVVVGAAVGTFVVLVGTPAKAPKPAWSNWKPTAGQGEQQAGEIANFVSRRYRLPTGTQLVGVLGGPSRIKAIAVQRGASNGDVDIFRSEGMYAYVLCGLGKRCAIQEGEPTLARARLLRREALELALYTFRYVPAAESVVAFLPPQKGKKAELALYFPKRDFKDELDRPLRHVLPAAQPPLPAEINPVESVMIDRLTEEHLFRFAVQQAQEGTDILVLAPVRL
jgi:hypothetical protein